MVEWIKKEGLTRE
jgi:hypothetical protein